MIRTSYHPGKRYCIQRYILIGVKFKLRAKYFFHFYHFFSISVNRETNERVRQLEATLADIIAQNAEANAQNAEAIVRMLQMLEQNKVHILIFSFQCTIISM